MPQCTIKKVIKNIPVSAMVNFLPIEEVKICLNVIMQNVGYCVVQNYGITVKNGN
jgi:hypothetical protein